LANIINVKKINDNDLVNYVKINDDLRIVKNSFHNTVHRMQKLDCNRGVNIETGEIIEFKRSRNRSQRMCDFKRSLAKLRDIIKLNVVDLEKCLFITLTYDDNISDREVFRKDFENFIKKFRRRYGECEYIKPVEYQGRGAIHCHLIIIFEKAPTVSITNENIGKCWKHGSVDVGTIESPEATAKYLTNFPFEYNESNEDLDYWFKTKKQKKSERVSFYAPHEKLYSCSKGIKHPETIKNIPYNEVKEKFSLNEAENCLTIWNDDNNIVTIENYKINKEKEAC
jgi:hypothetical protein